MKSFKQFLLEGAAPIKRIKPAPKPDNKTVWDRLRTDQPLTGWLFGNGGITFNRFTGHENNIRNYFRPTNQAIGIYVGEYVEQKGLAVHIEDDPHSGVIIFRANPSTKSFALKWAREMGITDKREHVRFQEPYIKHT